MQRDPVSEEINPGEAPGGIQKKHKRNPAENSRKIHKSRKKKPGGILREMLERIPRLIANKILEILYCQESLKEYWRNLKEKSWKISRNETGIPDLIPGKIKEGIYEKIQGGISAITLEESQVKL